MLTLRLVRRETNAPKGVYTSLMFLLPVVFSIGKPANLLYDTMVRYRFNLYGLLNKLKK